jgi:hypothetical protein
VLQANPETSDSKESLLNELQNRGRAAVGSKAWMDAKLLYEKAVTVCVSFDKTDDDTDQQQLKKASLFQANLSLVLKNMGEMEAARLAAQEATMSDATYVKGWWRLGQALSALHRPKDALEALEKAKSLEPTNKALLKECEKIASQVKEEEELLEIEAAAATAAVTTTTEAAAAAKNGDAMEVDSPDTPTTVKKKTIKNGKTTTATTTLHSNATITTFETMQVDDEEEEKSIFTKSDAVRGYKVVNGKKTSYFHNELSEEAKSLIGDIAPKKLDLPVSTPKPIAVGVAAADGTGGVVAPPPTTSAWNQAGTWEEKDVSKWATEQLKEAVLQTSFALPASSPAPNALVTVSKVTKLEGHASVAVARGKTRYIYEYALTLEWQIQNKENGLDCRGKVSIPDIDGTIELGEGYDMADFVIEQANDETVRPLLDRFVHRGGLKDALNESIDDWVRCFKKTYEMK